MKTSYNADCARDCSTLEKDLALCEKAGFDYIEIRLDLLRGWLKEHTVEQLKEFFETHRLKPHAINAVYLHQGMLPDETPDWDDPAMQDFKLACEVGSAIGSVEKNESIFAEASAPTAIRHASPKLVEKSPIRIYGRFSKMSFLMFSCFFIVPAPSACSGPRRRVLPVL